MEWSPCQKESVYRGVSFWSEWHRHYVCDGIHGPRDHLSIHIQCSDWWAVYYLWWVIPTLFLSLPDQCLGYAGILQVSWPVSGVCGYPAGILTGPGYAGILTGIRGMQKLAYWVFWFSVSEGNSLRNILFGVGIRWDLRRLCSWRPAVFVHQIERLELNQCDADGVLVKKKNLILVRSLDGFFLSDIFCLWLDFGLPPHCPQVVWCHWGEIEPFSATLAQDGLVECDQPGKNPLKYSAVVGNRTRATGS